MAMTARAIRHLVEPREVTEGAGVQVFRTVGTPALRNLDPFLLLDHFSSANPDDYIAGFPDHPHRGFITLTYMLEGHMAHRDSLGSKGDLGPGDAQWMKAASGVIHSEMPRQSDGLMQGFQLWLNLPATEKMSTPDYRDIRAREIPLVAGVGAKVKVLAGEYAGQAGPVADPFTRLRYLDVDLAGDTGFTESLEPEGQVFLYLFQGAVQVGGRFVKDRNLAVLGEGDRIELRAGPDGARFLLVSGRPLGEPIIQYGPFVMNTREEIEQALADYRDGRLVRQR
jgi:redox-sensitive bicupin YhaK (pirin superfamily)